MTLSLSFCQNTFLFLPLKLQKAQWVPSLLPQLNQKNVHLVAKTRTAKENYPQLNRLAKFLAHPGQTQTARDIGESSDKNLVCGPPLRMRKHV